MTIALICIFFTIFKGTTNILNALLVPLVLYVSLMSLKKEEGYTILGALFFVCFLFFRLQVIFTIFYILIAMLLIFVQRKKWPFPYAALLLSLALSLSFWIAIEATDALFLTHMGDIMLKAFHGNKLIYAGLIALEGTLVGIGLLAAARELRKRLHKVLG